MLGMNNAISLKRRKLSINVAGHKVVIKRAHSLTEAAKDLFEMAQGLGDNECLVFDRQAECVCVFKVEEALLLDAGKYLIIQNACGTGMAGKSLGEQ